MAPWWASLRSTHPTSYQPPLQLVGALRDTSTRFPVGRRPRGRAARRLSLAHRRRPERQEEGIAGADPQLDLDRRPGQAESDRVLPQAHYAAGGAHRGTPPGDM